MRKRQMSSKGWRCPGITPCEIPPGWHAGAGIPYRAGTPFLREGNGEWSPPTSVFERKASMPREGD